jgi:lysophospholipase L1-like esterase
MARAAVRESSPSARARRLSRIAIALVAALVALAAAEILLRRIDPEPAPLRFSQLGKVIEGDPRAQFMDLVEPDPELFWRLTPNVRLAADRRPFFGVISNARGLREDHEIAPKKSPDELRVLFLGDSVTFGYLLRPEETFVQVAEDELRARLAGTPVECVNAGVPGYSLFQGWRFLETRGKELAPDLVVFNFGWNDMVSWDGLGDFESHRRLAAHRPPGVLAHSRLARKLWATRATPAATDANRPRLTPAEFGQLLVDCKRSANALGAELMLFVGGSRANLAQDPRGRPLSDYQKQQFVFATATGVPVVDGVAIALELAPTATPGDVFLDQMHPGAKLNRAVGEALAERIATWRNARAAAVK